MKWIYYYASFGPGHQSSDYGFKSFGDDWGTDDIKEHLFHVIDSCGYGISLEFWTVEKPPANFVNNKIKELKDEIRDLGAHLNMLKFQDCFSNREVLEEKDPILIKNISRCIIPDLLHRLHKAGFMYGAEDISNWRYGKRCLMEPERSKILRIMRRTKKYPSIKERLRKQK